MRTPYTALPRRPQLAPAGPASGAVSPLAQEESEAHDTDTADFVVHLVDDDPDVRRALSRALSTRGLAVETYDRAEAFLAAYDPDQPGCLILDYGLPGMSGLDLQALILDHGHPLPIIFITGHGGVGEAVQAMRGGAIDFLEKPFRQDRLIDRIEAARKAASEMAADRARQRDLKARFRRLTRREAEVVRHMLDHPAGVSSKEIGRTLDISPRTVDHHRARILEKLEVTSVTEIFGLATELPRGTLPELMQDLAGD